MQKYDDNEDMHKPVLSTLQKGLKVIQQLTQGACQVWDIAQTLGLQKQTVYRILVTLRGEGWVVGPDHRDEYRLSGVFWSTASTVLLDDASRFIYRGLVDRVRESTAETVHLAIYLGYNEVLYVDKRDGTQPLRSYTELGGRSPASSVATGKTLLAQQESAEIDMICEGGLVQYTPRTIVDVGVFRAELETILDRGYAINRGEWRADVGGVAVPLTGSDGQVHAALGISGPVERVLERLGPYTEALFLARDGERSW